jgi:cytochrome b561
MDKARYTPLQRLLHWAVAVLVICGLTLGLTLGVLGFEGAKNTFGMDATNVIYKYHKTFGVLVLALMLVRLAVRLGVGRPEYDPPLPPVNRAVSRMVHGALYALLLVQPVLGWAATAAGGFPIEFFSWELPKFLSKNPALSASLYDLHGAVGLFLLVLITVHISAALFHWLSLRDNVIRRMSLF